MPSYPVAASHAAMHSLHLLVGVSYHACVAAARAPICLPLFTQMLAPCMSRWHPQPPLLHPPPLPLQPQPPYPPPHQQQLLLRPLHPHCRLQLLLPLHPGLMGVSLPLPMPSRWPRTTRQATLHFALMLATLSLSGQLFGSVCIASLC